MRYYREERLPETLLTAPLNAYDSEESDEEEIGLQLEGGSSSSSRARGLQCHRLRFVDFVPAAITSLSLCPTSFNLDTLCPWLAPHQSSSSSQLLAVGRASGEIQLFTTKDRRFLWSIPAALPSRSVENITWVHRTTLTPDEAELFPEDEPEEREAYLAKLRRHTPRLFSTSGSTVVEYDWLASRPAIKQRLELPGGAVCDMALDPLHHRQLAACSDTSQIHLIDVSEFDRPMEATRSLDCAGGGKLLSLAWLPKAQGFVTGGADSNARQWDLSGRCKAQMQVDRKGAKTLVWTVLVLENGQIVAGDSSGHVTVFDGKTNTQVSSFKSHRSDVLCLSASGTDHFFSAGCDQRTCFYSNSTQGWGLTITRRLHAHDIRAQVVTADQSMVISGGLDMQLTCTNTRGDDATKSFHNYEPRKTSYAPPQPALSFSRNHRVVLRRQQKVDVWQFDGKGQAWDLMAQLHLSAMGAITLSQISPDGKWIVVGDLWRTTLWQFKNGKLKSRTQFQSAFKSKLPDMDFVSASAATFSPDSSKLILASYPSKTVPAHAVWIDLGTMSATKALPLKSNRHQTGRPTAAANGHASGRALAGPKRLFNNKRDLGRKELETTTDDGMDSSSSEEEQDSEDESAKLRPAYASGTHIAINALGTVAVADSWRNLHVFSKEASHGLPTPPNPVAALSFLPHLPNILVVACNNSLLQIYDVQTRSYASWAKHFNSEDMNLKDSVIGLSVEPEPAIKSTTGDSSLSMVLWGSSFLISFRLPLLSALEQNSASEAPVTTGAKRQMNGDEAAEESKDVGTTKPEANPEAGLHSIRSNYKYEHVIGAQFLNHGELAVVERPYIDLLPELPAAFYKPAYGKA